MACAAIVAIVAPAEAEGKPGYLVFSGFHDETLSLAGSNGYEIQVVELNHRWVWLTARKGRTQVVYTLDRIRGKGDGIEARFPGVGRVSVRFHQQGRTRREGGFFPICGGGDTAKQRGYFSGTIRFRGERGYTVVRAHRARGEIATAEKEICKRSSALDSEPDPAPEQTNLFAYAESGGRQVGFSANIVGFPASTSGVFTIFSGGTWERRGPMEISRLALGEGVEEDFILGDAGDFPRSATVTPPGPFQGSASFQRGAEGDNTWTGSLSVVLPGVGRVALAGPRFEAWLCQAAGCRRAGRDGPSVGVYGARLLHRGMPLLRAAASPRLRLRLGGP